ncbi:MAG: hypothetical protein U0746_12150 [Gemmataceae bacterium]
MARLDAMDDAGGRGGRPHSWDLAHGRAGEQKSAATKGMIRTLLLFAAGCLAIAIPSLGIAYAANGEDGIVACALSIGLCVVPTLATLIMASLCFRSPPEVLFGILAVGSGVRMVVVLGGAAILTRVFPRLTAAGDLAFWGWVIVFYLFTLGWEVFLVAGRRQADHRAASIVNGDSVAR